MKKSIFLALMFVSPFASASSGGLAFLGLLLTGGMIFAAILVMVGYYFIVRDANRKSPEHGRNTLLIISASTLILLGLLFFGFAYHASIIPFTLALVWILYPLAYLIVVWKNHREATKKSLNDE